MRTAPGATSLKFISQWLFSVAISCFLLSISPAVTTGNPAHRVSVVGWVICQKANHYFQPAFLCGALSSIHCPCFSPWLIQHHDQLVFTRLVSIKQNLTAFKPGKFPAMARTSLAPDSPFDDPFIL